MCFRFRTEFGFVVVLLLAGCAKGTSAPSTMTDTSAPPGSVIASALAPGLPHSTTTVDPRAAQYYDNADAVVTGKRLFGQYNCSGCHSNGGGGMGPSLMDNEWIYGGRLEQIHQTLVEGRPNGMPTWGGKIPDEQLWQISAYVRSMSLPETLAAQQGPTPSQSPAPVPHVADQDSGWSAPEGTTNDYTAHVQGPQ
jgi:cytochrome c oxidase cbb3-type subunit III